jgi:hypothetical protein
MSDIYNIGKHLAKDRDQLDPRNRLLLEILFDIYFVGIDSESRAAKQIGIKANDIRMAFFDNTKRLLDAIPDVLLVRDIVGEAVGPRHFRWVPPDAVVEDGLTSRESPELKPTIAARRTAPADAGAGSPPVPGLRGASKVTERRSAKKAPPGKGGKKGLVPSRRTRPQNPGQATPSRGRKRR